MLNFVTIIFKSHCILRNEFEVERRIKFYQEKNSVDISLNNLYLITVIDGTT